MLNGKIPTFFYLAEDVSGLIQFGLTIKTLLLIAEGHELKEVEKKLASHDSNAQSRSKRIANNRPHEIML